MDNQQRLKFNEDNIAEFRASHGRIASFGDAPLLLLTTTGAKSGQRRTSPMMYLADEGDLDRVYVFASAAGADQDPAWFHNLVAHPDDLEVEIGDKRYRASAEVVPEPRRTELYAAQASRYPGFAGTRKRRPGRSQWSPSSCGTERSRQNTVTVSYDHGGTKWS